MNQPACNPSADGRSIAGRETTGKTYLDVEDLQVYQKLCQLHLEICDLSHTWPAEERYEDGLEKSLERRFPEKECRWAVADAAGEYDEPNPEPRTLNT